MAILPNRTVPKVTSVAMTRPANTTAYTAGQVFNDVGATAIAFTSVIQTAGSGGIVSGGKLIINSIANPTVTYRLFLFSGDPGTTTDGTTFALAWANRALRIGWIDFVNPVVGSDCIEYTGLVSDQSLLFNLGSTGTTIYGQMITNTAYTPTSGLLSVVSLATLS